MISIFHAIILGIVEGLTEFLPISSTAHMTLVAEIMRLAQSDAVKSFEIVIQGGAILAVVALYWRKFLDIEILKRVCAAFLPTAVVGFILYKIIKSFLIGNLWVTLTALAVGGVILVFSDKLIGLRKSGSTPESAPESVPAPESDDLRTISYRKYIYIGLIQSLAVIPGVSRSAATIIGGLWLGISKKAIVELSFLLAVPTILAAAGYDLLKNLSVFSSSDITSISIGFVAAFITALVAIKLFMSYVQNHSFRAFGIYRIVVAASFAVWLIAR
jgi:undecaprenyl-diphosphatase